ncbi:MAG: transporter substrate-binding domain-containing protein [Polyangiaceae bacterium]|nr:transporter substrate-binding domain-containing protein [Polyangiaceae bacterium]
MPYLGISKKGEIQPRCRTIFQQLAATAIPLCACFFLFSCRGTTVADTPIEEVLTPEEQAWLHTHDGQITLAPSDSYPPMDFIDAYGEHRGIAADYFRLIEQRLGFRFRRVRLGTWDNILEGGEKKTLDVTTLAQRTVSREKFWLFSTPYIDAPAAIIGRQERSKRLALSDLGGKRVAVVEGYAVVETTLQKIPNIELVQVPDDITGLLKVSFGDVDFMVTELPVALYHIDHEGITNLRVVGDTGYAYHYSIASRNDSPLLASILEKGLRLITPQERKRIQRRWIRLEDWEKLQHQPFGWLGRWAFIALLGGIVFALIVWRRLRVKVVGQSTELKATRKELEGIFRSTPSAMALLSNQGHIKRANPAFIQLARLLAPGVEDSESIDTCLKACSWFERAVQEGQRLEEPHRWRETLALSTGERHFDMTVFPTSASTREKKLLLRIDDVTSNVAAARQAETSHRMKTLGTLAGGIAHDFNNALAIMTSVIGLLRRQAKSDKPISSDLLGKNINALEHATANAQGLMQQLLSISAQKDSEQRPFDLALALKETFELGRTTIDKSIHMSLDLQVAHAQVLGDRAELERVILNLLLNAAHAMTWMRSDDATEGGELTLSLSEASQEERLFGKIRTPDSQKYYLIKVSDTGVGMDSQTQSRAFDPFFTTKDRRGGTGLGLAMAYRVIESHGGTIQLESQLGKGTSVHLLFPAPESYLDSSPPSEVSALSIRSRRLLLVEDDNGLAEVTEQLLRELGYEPILAKDGLEALRLFEEEQKNIDIVLLDIVLPQLSGDEVCRRIRLKEPNLPIVLTSGFAQDPRVQKTLQEGDCRFLAKPYSLDELRESLERALHQAAEAERSKFSLQHRIH